MSSNEDGNGSTDMTNGALVTGGVVAGIVICSILFLIVIALVIYNIYLFRRRRAADRRARLINRKYDPGWRPAGVLYDTSGACSTMSRRLTPTGSGNVNAGFVPSKAGSTVSMGSWRYGAGTAPRAQLEDDQMDVSDDYLNNVGGRQYVNLDPGGTRPVGIHKPPRPSIHNPQSHFNSVNGRPNYGANQPPAQIDAYHQQVPPRHSPYVTRQPEVPHEQQEVQLEPGRLAAEHGRDVPTASYPHVTRTSSSSPGRNDRNSCLAVLSTDTSHLRHSDVSLTGFGALSTPSLGLDTSRLSTQGQLGYSAY